MNIYDSLVEGIKSALRPIDFPIETYLKSLQPSVRELRRAYKNFPAIIDYRPEQMQGGYLLAYMPHYYQLIQKILRERKIAESVTEKYFVASFIGGGPGSEAYGLIKYLLENNNDLKKITINIFDINAKTWVYSNKIIQDNLIKSLFEEKDIDIVWNACSYNMTSKQDTLNQLRHFQNSNLIVVQNCINEITDGSFSDFKNNLKTIFNRLPDHSSLLIIDLTSSIRNRIKIIEHELKEEFAISNINSTLGNASASSMISLNALPSPIVKQNLLIGTDGLIPRKNLRYDYSYMQKGLVKNDAHVKDSIGFSSLYEPLSVDNLDKISEAKNKVFVGFDFGTSVTVISICYIENGVLELKPLALTQKDHNGDCSHAPLVPTVMAVSNNHFMLGKHAEENLTNLTIGREAWAYFKEHLGHLATISYPDSILKTHNTCQIVNAKQGLITFFKLIFSQIELEIEKILPGSKCCYTWSVPAAYSLAQKEELIECATLAGFPMEDTPIVEEPISALVNYVYESSANFKNNLFKDILVLDVGAGTVDVSIMEITTDTDNINLQLLAVERIAEIGGNKINKLMVDLLLANSPELVCVPNLKFYCEKLKKVICKAIVTDHTVNYQLPPLACSAEESSIIVPGGKNLSLSFQEFKDIMLEYWGAENESVFSTIKSALNNAKIGLSDIGRVILTGGGGRNPYLQSLISSCFVQSELIVSDNIQEQVSRGNALQAFTQHVFGKNIINSLLHHNIVIKTNEITQIIIPKGVTCPSMDYEIKIKEQEFSLIYGMEMLTYTIPDNEVCENITIYVNNNLQIVCEIVCANRIKIIKPIIKKL